MAFDRAATLKNAEQLLREGKLEPAITEYQLIVDAQPGDWESANTLGDLYARAGRIDDAVEQFVRVADHLNAAGFMSQAIAAYEKILNLRPDHEHSLSQVAARRESHNPHAIDIEAILGELEPAPHAPPPLVGSDLEGVFSQLRHEAAHQTNIEGDESSTRAQFASAAALGRMYRDRGMVAEALEWFERAAQVPSPAPADYHALLLDLADVLERAGETARALAVCLELQADAGEYADVKARISRLSGVQAGGTS